jgi:hypothetical protein
MEETVTFQSGAMQASRQTRLVRLGFAAFLLLHILACAANGYVELELSWRAIFNDVIALFIVTFLLPRILPRPHYAGTLLSGGFFPVKTSWPVWIFWWFFTALLLNFTVMLKSAFEGRIDESFTRVIILAPWCWIALCGRFGQWKSRDS